MTEQPNTLPRSEKAASAERHQAAADDRRDDESETGPSYIADGGATSTSQTDPLLIAYRHDSHKMAGRGHADATDTHAGVRVNETVPREADRDAALLSRPRGEPEQTVANHASPYRLSLVTGESAVTTDRILAAGDDGFDELVASDNPTQLHARWLTSETAAAYSESVYYPYTSLRYHVLLTAALLDNYRAGNEFDELFLVATAPAPTPDAHRTLDAERALTADTVEPHRTVLWTPHLALHVTATPGERPAARLGTYPTRCFGDVWSRLSEHPIDVDGQRQWRLLDAQLRRIRSWSAALAYITDYLTSHGVLVPGGADEE